MTSMVVEKATHCSREIPWLIPKLGQIGPKWDKSWTSFGEQKQKFTGTETDLKKSQICPIRGRIWPNLDGKFDIPGGSHWKSTGA